MLSINEIPSNRESIAMIPKVLEQIPVKSPTSYGVTHSRLDYLMRPTNPKQFLSGIPPLKGIKINLYVLHQHLWVNAFIEHTNDYISEHVTTSMALKKIVMQRSFVINQIGIRD